MDSILTNSLFLVIKTNGEREKDIVTLERDIGGEKKQKRQQ